MRRKRSHWAQVTQPGSLTKVERWGMLHWGGCCFGGISGVIGFTGLLIAEPLTLGKALFACALIWLGLLGFRAYVRDLS